MVANVPVLICVGATKCGTSWLYDYFRSHPDCGLRVVKELRYFTAVDWDLRKVQADIIAERLGTLKKKIAAAEPNVPPWMQKARADLTEWHPIIEGGDVQAYVDYLHNVRDDAKLIGDISPEYSRLSAERLAQMARLTDDVRFLYVVREPMDRFWSHVRMTARDRARHFGTDDADIRAGRIARRTIAEAGDAEVVESGAYRRNLAKLSAMGAGRVKVVFYEELFQDDMIAEICAYLGIRFKAGDYGREVFKGEGMAFPDEIKGDAFAYLRDEYDAVETYMGRLPEAWIKMRDAMS